MYDDFESWIFERAIFESTAQLNDAIKRLESELAERKRAEDALHEELGLTTHLLKFAETAARIPDIDTLMVDVTIRCRAVMRCTVCLTYLWDKERKIFIPGKEAGLSQELLPVFRTEPLGVDMALVEDARETRKPIVIESSPGENFWPFQMMKDVNAAVVSVLIGKEDYVGLILCIYTGTHHLIERSTLIMEGICRQVTNVLEQAKLFKESVKHAMDLSSKIETLRVMHEIDRGILSTLRSEEILETAVKMVSKAIPCDRATIALVDRERQGFIHKAGFGLVAAAKETFIPFGDTSATEAVKAVRAHSVADLNDLKTRLPFEKELLQEGFASRIIVPLTIENEVIGILDIGSKMSSAFSRDNLLMSEKLASQISVALANARLVTELEKLYHGTVKSLSSAIDDKSPWTIGHSARVTNYALAIAQELGMDKKALKDLETAGLLHDIGKIGTYESILDKSERLTDDELQLIKRQPAKSVEILAPIQQLIDIIPAIKHQHEFYDGRGYPDGLKGESIPLSARILMVAESAVAMSENRPYRKGKSIGDIVTELKRCSGTQFDPKVVGAFLKVLSKSKAS